MRPRARRSAILLQSVGDQLVVYEQKRRRLHVLSQSAALVWQHCDGERDLGQLAALLGRELDSNVDEDVVVLALKQLEDADLLESVLEPGSPNYSVSRREMLNRAMGGLAAGVLLPVVTSCGSLVDSTMAAAGNVASNVGVFLETSTTGTSTTGTTGTSTTGTTATSTTGTTGTTTTSTTGTTGTTSTSTTGTTTTSTTTTPSGKVPICHNGKTIMVDSNAVDAHLRHGDTLGACP